MSERYTYRCANDGASVTKKPVGTIPAKKGEPVITGLHGWRCSKCGAGVKVLRQLN